MSQPSFTTDYTARAVSREAYLSWLSRANANRRHKDLPILADKTPSAFAAGKSANAIRNSI